MVEDSAFASSLQFAKGADGDGEMVGQMVDASGEARAAGRFSGGRFYAGGVSARVLGRRCVVCTPVAEARGGWCAPRRSTQSAGLLCCMHKQLAVVRRVV